MFCSECKSHPKAVRALKMRASNIAIVLTVGGRIMDEDSIRLFGQAQYISGKSDFPGKALRPARE
jgi:hypothetical protein